jgi:hypothetical protein
MEKIRPRRIDTRFSLTFHIYRLSDALLLTVDTIQVRSEVFAATGFDKIF